MICTLNTSRLLLVVLVVFLLGSSTTASKEYEVVSPDSSISITINTTEQLAYSISFRDKKLVLFSHISMILDDGTVLGANPVVIKSERRNVEETITPIVSEKSSKIQNTFSELSLTFEGGWGFDVRAFNDGVAYRFRTFMSGPLKVVEEKFNANFARDSEVFFSTEESFLTHTEPLYERLTLTNIENGKMASLPILVDVDTLTKILITESDLQDYPGMYIAGTDNTGLKGVFPRYPLKEEQVDDRTVRVTERAEWIALTKGKRTFPWRVFVIASEDKELIKSSLVYQLAPENKLEDISWIRPGKSVWDWWSTNNIYGVDFKTGQNTETYKYYIDFAANYGFEYITIDIGWSKVDDLFAISPNMDMEEIITYAKSRNVGVILWVMWKTLEEQLQPALDQFQNWGVAGIKVDYMMRDDQLMVNYYWKIAEEAAKRQLLVNFHGAYKPTGLRRAYPNVLTREGVRGLEHSKWSKQPTPEHNVTIPFIRMPIGPMDYTPGAMLNSQRDNFRSVYSRPMSLGTRSHQLAMLVVFESPLKVFADSPSAYLKEMECLKFLSAIPTVWDETLVLDGKVGDYVVIARRKDEEWYVAAMTDWNARELTLELSFLNSGTYIAEIFEDGINAERNANDYNRLEKPVSNADHIKIRLAPGGGWVARIKKQETIKP